MFIVADYAALKDTTTERITTKTAISSIFLRVFVIWITLSTNHDKYAVKIQISLHVY